MADMEGLPPGSVLSIRFGGVRRQAAVDKVHSGHMTFPSSSFDCGDPLKIEVLQPVAHGRLVLQQSDREYQVRLNSKGDAGPMRMGLRISQVEVNGNAPKKGKEIDGPGTLKYQDAAVSAREYLEHHGLLRYIQGLLHAIIQARPEDPFNFMIEQLTSSMPRPPEQKLQQQPQEQPQQRAQPSPPPSPQQRPTSGEEAPPRRGDEELQSAKERARQALCQGLLGQEDELEAAKERARDALNQSARQRAQEDELETAKEKARDALNQGARQQAQEDELEAAKERARDAMHQGVRQQAEEEEQLESAKERARGALYQSLLGEDEAGPPSGPPAPAEVEGAAQPAADEIEESRQRLKDALTLAADNGKLSQMVTEAEPQEVGDEGGVGVAVMEDPPPPPPRTRPSGTAEAPPPLSEPPPLPLVDVTAASALHAAAEAQGRLDVGPPPPVRPAAPHRAAEEGEQEEEGPIVAKAAPQWISTPSAEAQYPDEDPSSGIAGGELAQPRPSRTAEEEPIAAAVDKTTVKECRLRMKENLMHAIDSGALAAVLESVLAPPRPPPGSPQAVAGSLPWGEPPPLPLAHPPLRGDDAAAAAEAPRRPQSSERRQAEGGWFEEDQRPSVDEEDSMLTAATSDRTFTQAGKNRSLATTAELSGILEAIAELRQENSLLKRQVNDMAGQMAGFAGSDRGAV